MSRSGRYGSDDDDPFQAGPSNRMSRLTIDAGSQSPRRHEVPTAYIPVEEVADTYLEYTDVQRRQMELARLGLRPARFVNPSQQWNPWKQWLPKTAAGEVAVYGEYGGRPIHGPAEWHQWYPTWNRIGQQYMGPDPRLPGPKVTDQKTSTVCPLHQQHMRFLIDKGFRFISLLGTGGFGQVWKVEQSLAQPGSYPEIRTFACKIISLHKLVRFSVKKAMTEMCREAEVYENLNHDNIVHRTEMFNLMDSESGFPKPIHVVLLMEMMEGDLFALLFPEDDDPAAIQQFEESRIRSGWIDSPEKFTQNWVKQIVSGLLYLHQRNIAHMDLKPENILFSTDSQSGQTIYTFKLTDFGLARRFPGGEPCTGKGMITTDTYASPEQSTGQSYDAKASDIFSLGYCIISSLAGNDFEFRDVRNAIKVYHQTVGRMYRISRACADLVKAMIDDDPQERPDIVKVEQHDWLRQSEQ